MKSRRRRENEGPLASMVDMMFGGVGVGAAFFLAFILARLPGVESAKVAPRTVVIEIPSNARSGLGVMVYAGGKWFANEEMTPDDFALRAGAMKPSAGLPFASPSWILDLKDYKPTPSDVVFVYLAIPPRSEMKSIPAKIQVLGIPSKPTTVPISVDQPWCGIRLATILSTPETISPVPWELFPKPQLSGNPSVDIDSLDPPRWPNAQPDADTVVPNVSVSFEQRNLGPTKRHQHSFLGYLRSLYSNGEPQPVPAFTEDGARWYSQFVFEADAERILIPNFQMPNLNHAAELFDARLACDNIRPPKVRDLEAVDAFYRRQQMECWHVCARRTDSDIQCVLVQRESDLCPILSRSAIACRITRSNGSKIPPRKVVITPDLYEKLTSDDEAAAKAACERILEVMIEVGDEDTDLIIGGRGHWNKNAFRPTYAKDAATFADPVEEIKSWVIGPSKRPLFAHQQENWTVLYKVVLATEESLWPTLGIRQHPLLWYKKL